MAGEINNFQAGAYTNHSNKPIGDFSSHSEIINDEIITYTQNKYGDLISELGLNTDSMSVMDLADALNKNENSSLSNEISELQEALSGATMELAKQYYSDENITVAEFGDGRKTAIDYFSLFNKDYDKAVELQNFVLDKNSQIPKDISGSVDSNSVSKQSASDKNTSIETNYKTPSYNPVSENNASENNEPETDQQKPDVSNESSAGKEIINKFASAALGLSDAIVKTDIITPKTPQEKNYDLNTVVQNYSQDNTAFKTVSSELSSLWVNNKLTEGKMTIKGQQVEVKQNDNGFWEVSFEDNKSMTLSKKTNGSTGLKINKKSWASSKGVINAYYGHGQIGKSGWYIDVNGDNKANYILNSANTNTTNGKDVFLGKD